MGGNIRKTVGYLSYTKDEETLTASTPEEMSIWDKSGVLRGIVITIMVLLPLAVIAGVVYLWIKKHRRERNRLLKCKLLNICICLAFKFEQHICAFVLFDLDQIAREPAIYKIETYFAVSK